MSRETVVPVEIVRPRPTWKRALGIPIGSLVSVAISAWIVMLLAPQVYDHVGYWQAFAFVLIVRSAIGQESYVSWTRGRR